MPHLPLVAGLSAGFLAQSWKFFWALVRHRQLDFRLLVRTGGFPSSHTALVVGLTTMIGLTEGFDAPLFDCAAVFSAIVMYDAAGVRRAAGRQAAVLNRIVAEFQQDLRLSLPKLQELLGHTPIEVLGGAVLGVLWALGMHRWLG
ncbi:MAG: divergent PAP2 family protein [Candidatus Sericytochromatia bacterium]|nr:divergent PAP2 family protein [Candidatus Sericytochromatia bacterium]